MVVVDGVGENTSVLDELQKHHGTKYKPIRYRLKQNKTKQSVNKNVNRIA